MAAKNIVVIFRMYQLNLDGQEDRIYKKYWDTSAVHFVEPNFINCFRMCEMGKRKQNYYGSLCTEMYEILHEQAPRNELNFYLPMQKKGRKS